MGHGALCRTSQGGELDLTPNDFIETWRKVELKERSASQSHFSQLCTLLGLLDPVTADPKGEWFMFEKGASKSSGGEGWADVWRKDCFAWEYKGKRKNLDDALTQLRQYTLALDNPPLLIVSDMDEIHIHTNWTNTVHKTFKIKLDDLTDAATRDKLRYAFTDPERLKPEKTRALLTEEAAEKFAKIAQRLRERGHEAEAVAAAPLGHLNCYNRRPISKGLCVLNKTEFGCLTTKERYVNMHA